ncbi:MAG: DPP IV N-terminal domain-containing protein [Taibaiella sp.]|nr:DPP IV N-terminal domain-containing protein [Taibaiella sp.]
MNCINRIFLLIVAVITCSSVQAQKKLFTMAEATNGMAGTLQPKTIKQPTWEPGTSRLWQVVKTNNSEAWAVTSFSSKYSDTLLTLDALNKSTSLNLKALPVFTWLDKEYLYFTSGKDIEKGILTAKGLTWNKWCTTPDNADNITVDKSMQIAYTTDNNLWMVDKKNHSHQLTTDADKNILNGQAVHRNEFGIDKGIFFSPKGDLIAYYHMDQTMVNDYPVVDWSITPAKNTNIKYPMAGGTSHQAMLAVYNIATGKTVYMQTGEHKDHYLTCATWSPDEQYIYIAILNREQNHLWLNQYDAETGKVIKTLFEETDAKYVQPLHPLSFLPGSNDKFIWWSQRDGYMHLYLYNTNGKELRQLTRGTWVINEIAGFNQDGDKVIFTSSKESPLEKHAYTVNWNNGKVERIDKGAGMHTIIASEDGHYIYDSYTGAGVPRKCVVRSTDGNMATILVNAADPLKEYDRPTVKNITLKAADGKTDLYGKLILPINFDKSKKYPVIVYLYNGPNVQLIHNQFPESGNLWYEYMAQKGYIVFTMDGRGSSNRGLAFEQVTFRRLGDIEMADQLKGVDYLKTLPYVDASRMGVHGWSFGGFMTTSLMLKHPDVFKCAVAGGSVMDWKMYEVMYTERYMDTPEENPAGYENANLLDKVKNLKGKLLLIHGTNDDVVVWQNSIDFIKKCVDENVQVDYFVYPGHQHNVRGKDRVHLMQKISDYFDLYLK